MNRMPLLTAALAITITAAFTSCKPSKVWATKDKDDKQDERYDRDDRDDRYGRDDRIERYEPAPPPPPRYSSTRLVISPTPGFVMNRYPDGRYYHRSPQGLLYWKGSDDRFFLDRNYLRKVSFSQREYEEWRRISRTR